MGRYAYHRIKLLTVLPGCVFPESDPLVGWEVWSRASVPENFRDRRTVFTPRILKIFCYEEVTEYLRPSENVPKIQSTLHSACKNTKLKNPILALRFSYLLGHRTLRVWIFKVPLWTLESPDFIFGTLDTLFLEGFCIRNEFIDHPQLRKTVRLKMTVDFLM